MSSLPSSVIGPDLRAALVAMVRKRVPESEVEDIVQATLADAFGSPHAPSDAESFRRWIFGVAKNKVVDYHRRAGRETFEVPEVPETPAPHAEADLLRWAERNLPPGEENKTTLDWMLREGEGEKLEWIAETEKVPAPRVRQRVSRLRRHLKDHWQKEVALLATVGVLITALFLVLREKAPQPIANEDPARGEELRKRGLEKCLSGVWKDCLDTLDAAKRLDPAGDTRPEVQLARENANKALTLPPMPQPVPTAAPSSELVAPPKSKLEKTVPAPSAGPTGTDMTPSPKPVPTPPPPAPAKPTSGLDGDPFGSGLGLSDTKEDGTKAPPSTKQAPMSKANGRKGTTLSGGSK